MKSQNYRMPDEWVAARGFNPKHVMCEMIHISTFERVVKTKKKKVKSKS